MNFVKLARSLCGTLGALPRYLLILFSSVGGTNFASGYTSDAPVVKSMTEAGVKVLGKTANTKPHYPLTPFHTGGLGELSLAGYAMMKVTHDSENPVVKEGVRAAKLFVAAMSGRDPGGHASKSIYAATCATLVLAEVDLADHLKELKALNQYFKRVQFRNGAYGYVGDPMGDVSQTQYAILALWTLDNAGVIIDYEGVVRTMNWLLRVQDVSGAWPYQGKEPPGNQRIKQTIEVGVSMANAGGSALMIAADILGLWDDGKDGSGSGITGIPKAVQRAEEQRENSGIKRPEFPVDRVKSAIADCDKYLASHDNKQVLWPFYNIYTVERYQSFRDKVFKRPPNAPAKWYDDGVDFLKGKQAGNGGWNGTQQYVTTSTATAFSILFLSRSTQKAIEQTQEGTLAGGFGLPTDTTKIRVDGTQIKGQEVAGAVTDLLDMLEGGDGDALEGKSLPEDLKLATEPKARKVQIERLERLLRGSTSWQARRVAARTLGQSDEIKVVPSLIFALDDGDTVVRTFARDGLRFISRKFEGFGMKIQPGDKQDYGELRRAQRLWREWYLTMDPGYIFVTD